jgi:hypothetical protein
MKKGVVIVTLFFIFIMQKGVSQYYSKRINFYNQNNSTAEFLLLNDTFYLSTDLIDTGEGLLGKISNTGNLSITPKFAAAFTGSYYQPIQTINYRKNFYTTGGGGYNSKVSSSFYKFNSNGDTLQTHYYGDTAYTQITERIIPYYKTKSKLLLIGVTDSTCGPGHQGTGKSIIRVVDTSGVLCQTKMYLSNCAYRNITSVDTAEKKGYLIGYGGWFSTWQTETRVMKLDSNLNIIWDKQINIVSGGSSNVVNHQNKYYTVLSTHVDSVWNFSYKWERISLTRLDLNGNIIWQKYYGHKERPMITSGLKECANGDYIMCGSHYNDTYQLKSWLMRTDSAGNLKWWKDYTAKTLPVQDTISENYLYDVLELPNGDIAAVGWCGGSSINPLQQTWLLKVDSNGCFGAGNCPTNITTGINDINPLNKVEAQISAYPNPFKDELNINYSILDFERTAQLQLIELASGRIINSIELTQSFGTKQFNTENIANGLYVLSLKQNNKPSVNFKVINIK